MAENIIKRANGKLLLTGEYAVLDGATALGLPTKYGQTIAVIKDDNEESIIKWESLDMYHEIWFKGTIHRGSCTFTESSDNDIASTLEKILQLVIQQKGNALDSVQKIRVKADYPLQWGLGSSASLVSSIAQVFGVDPYAIQQEVFRGSGYDIACAVSKDPILYTNSPEVEDKIQPVDFKPARPNFWVFVYLGNKKDSREAIDRFEAINQDKSLFVSTIDSISREMAISNNHNDQLSLLQKHEDTVSAFMNLPKVQNLYFDDFEGVVKSLGAWGGDFVVAVSKTNETDLDYFYQKGYPTVFPYTSIIMK